MAHFAKINENNIVIDVNVVDNKDVGNLEYPASESVGIQFLIPWNTPNTYWKQTSYNRTFRKNYAGIGFTYDAQRDAFIPPSPFPSWILDEETCLWNPPVPAPTDGEIYNWDEATQQWIQTKQKESA